jgi:hypothetical protein
MIKKWKNQYGYGYTQFLSPNVKIKVEDFSRFEFSTIDVFVYDRSIAGYIAFTEAERQSILDAIIAQAQFYMGRETEFRKALRE